MRKEITIGIIIGLLWGSGMLAPGAVFRTPEPMPETRVAPQQPVSLPELTEGGRPLSYYEAIDERDLFRPAVLPHTPPPRTRRSADLPAFPKPAWRSPLQGWAYAGYAAIDGVAVAILQESSSAQAVFLREGENFRGGDVEEITPDRVQLAFEEGLEMIPKSDAYNTVPLDSTSTAAASTPRTPQIRRPNRPAAVPTTPAAAAPRPSEVRPRVSATGNHGQRSAELRAEWESRRRRMMRRGESAPSSEVTLPPPRLPNRLHSRLQEESEQEGSEETEEVDETMQ
ncbi:MAG: hypothetical protein GTO55_05080 [Armatimonadetes bacterium]|nr:hypothetical protein [Armatimonadota bacterium]NIM23640.1 hypothetical protein [Armatimonadota bacterium]NIM67507.1 hypothetical protein [Armatimonadota bacterium]NIM76003.1 hypothetical protein [Armatimonadota bacterium]NIN05692.1 hypothetical protein [Armatimonadota bacterium]